MSNRNIFSGENEIEKADIAIARNKLKSGGTTYDYLNPIPKLEMMKKSGSIRASVSS